MVFKKLKKKYLFFIVKKKEEGKARYCWLIFARMKIEMRYFWRILHNCAGDYLVYIKKRPLIGTDGCPAGETISF